jgi:6,7-dimethyl-8-ribityllumazine synthase
MSDYKTTLKNIDHIDRDIRIAFVVGEFNLHHTAPLEKINREFLEENGFGNIDSYWVPGAFEIPGFTAKILEGDQYDLVITL